MNVDEILLTLNGRNVSYLLIGGVNFMLRHAPQLTFDVDIWIEDTPENRACCVQALVDMGAEWGRNEADWGSVERLEGDWLTHQDTFSLTTRYGPVDVFRSVTGLSSWREAFERSDRRSTAEGVSYVSLGDEDMLICQLALPESEQKQERIRLLRAALGQSNG